MTNRRCIMISRSCTLILFALALANAVGCANDAKPEPASQGNAVKASTAITPQARVADPVYGYVDELRADLSDGKTKIINDVMRLTPAESAKFWPIYRDYEEELFTLGDSRVEMTRSLARAQLARTLDDANAATLTNQWFHFEFARLDLMRKYQKRIASELSPLRAA